MSLVLPPYFRRACNYEHFRYPLTVDVIVWPFFKFKIIHIEFSVLVPVEQNVFISFSSTKSTLRGELAAGELLFVGKMTFKPESS